MSRRVVVDVDNTLWDFSGNIRKVLHREYGMPLDYRVNDWDFFDDFMEPKEFWKAVHALHSQQETYLPYDNAHWLFGSLNRSNVEVFVASHRGKDHGPSLASWLEDHGMIPFSGLYVGWNKHFLIKPNTIVLDDNPKTIRYAKEHNAFVGTIRHSWNEHEECPKFDNLKEATQWIVNILEQ